jgi:hypothetical protein
VALVDILYQLIKGVGNGDGIWVEEERGKKNLQARRAAPLQEKGNHY